MVSKCYHDEKGKASFEEVRAILAMLAKGREKGTITEKLTMCHPGQWRACSATDPDLANPGNLFFPVEHPATATRMAPKAGTQNGEQKKKMCNFL